MEQRIESPGRLARVAARWLLVAAALLTVGWLLWRAREAMTPFIFGLVLAYLLAPLVSRLERIMRRPLAILLVYLAGFGLIVASVVFVVPPVVDQVQLLVESAPSVAEVQAIGNRLLGRYHAALPAAITTPIDAGVAQAIETAQANASAYVQGLGGLLVSSLLRVVNTITFLLGFLIVPIWLFYVLNDQRQGRAFVDRLLHPRIRPDFWNVWHMVNKVFSDYIRGQLLLGVAIGLMAGIGLLVLQLFGFETRYILLLAIIAGVTELVPIIGPIVGAIPAVVIAFLTPDNPVGNGVAVLVLYIVIQQLENNILVPRIVGESVGVHPAVLMVLLIAMGEVFGLIGVILSAPVAAVSRDLFTYAYRRFGGAAPRAALRDVFAEKEGPDMNAVDAPRPDQQPTPPGLAAAVREERAQEHEGGS